MSSVNQIYDNFVEHLRSLSWVQADSNSKYMVFSPPQNLNFDPDYKLFLPRQFNKSDFIRNIDKLILTLSNIYHSDADDLSTLIIDNKQILSFHIEDENVVDGKPSIPHFDQILGKIKELLMDSASFTVLQKPHFYEKPEEAERYVNLCRFIKNEKGSLISKIQVPKDEDIKEKTLFDEAIKGSEVNNKLISVMDFVNKEIITSGIYEPEDDFLIDNKEFININVTDRIKDFYKAIELADISIDLITGTDTKTTSVKELNKEKTDNLSKFTKKVKDKINEIVDYEVYGKVIELKSRDVEGDRNSIQVQASIKDVKSIVHLTLSTDDYQQAIDAHKNNKTVYIKALMEKKKSSYTVQELRSFKKLNK